MVWDNSQRPYASKLYFLTLVMSDRGGGLGAFGGDFVVHVCLWKRTLTRFAVLKQDQIILTPAESSHSLYRYLEVFIKTFGLPCGTYDQLRFLMVVKTILYDHANVYFVNGILP